MQNYDFALIVGTSLCDVGLIIRILYKRAKGTSLHLGSSATPSRYRGWDAGELPLAPTAAYESARRGSSGLSARRAPDVGDHTHTPRMVAQEVVPSGHTCLAEGGVAPVKHHPLHRPVFVDDRSGVVEGVTAVQSLRDGSGASSGCDEHSRVGATRIHKMISRNGVVDCAQPFALGRIGLVDVVASGCPEREGHVEVVVGD